MWGALPPGCWRLPASRGRSAIADRARRAHHQPAQDPSRPPRLPLPRVVIDELEQHLTQLPAGTELVFPAARGGYARSELWRRRTSAPAVTRAGLEPLRPHDLRHTAVALWIAAGASPREIANRAGHTSVVTVLDRTAIYFPAPRTASMRPSMPWLLAYRLRMTERQTYHSPEALTAWAREHLRHELVQLAAMAITQTVDHLVLTPQRSASWVGNAMLESFLMHARAIDDFLRNDHDHPKNRRVDDVLAVDFLPAWDPRDVLARDDREGINKQLAHLSIQRRPGLDRPWHYPAIVSALLAGMAEFLAEVRDAKSEDRRIEELEALEIGWQHAMQLLAMYGLLANDGARQPRDGEVAVVTNTESSAL